MDNQSGTVVGTQSTDAKGEFITGKAITLPAPLAGGEHMLFGVGETSGIVGWGPVNVLPVSTMTPTALAAGDVTTVSAMGFVPGETVSMAFPDGPPSQLQADGSGSVQTQLPSPPEPYGGGFVTASAPSGTVKVKFSAIPQFTTVTQAQPWDEVPVTMTGYGAGEPIVATFDNNPPTQTFVADASGSVSDELLLDTVFGTHDITMTGLNTGVTKTVGHVSMPAKVTVSPSSGPPGTVITITSGPGWVPLSILHVTWSGSIIANPVADAHGAISVTFTVPQRNPGNVKITVKDDGQLGFQPQATFTVT
jgi:hypothetical protein